MPKSHSYQRTGPYSGGLLSKFWDKNKRNVLLGVTTVGVLIIALGAGLGVGLKGSTHTPSRSIHNNDYSDTNTTNYSGWKPAPGISWQIVLSDTLSDSSANAEVFDIDLFTNTADTITKLHSLDKKVICYFSVGSYEDFRPDSNQFMLTDYGNGLDGWQGEWWLNTNSLNVRAIMLRRMDLAVEKGCDGIDPDNIDGFENDSGLELSQDTAVEYLTFLASEAHKRNLAIGLKNGGNIVDRIVGMMQWEVNEQCKQFNECSLFQPFIAAKKPVFHIEYPSSAPNVDAETKATICGNSDTTGFSTVLKNMNLDNWFETC
jgi:endo-alpha-1,4-polygalactosaminidase (GH114 family)